MAMILIILPFTDISERIRLKVITGEGVDVNYWAAWRDTPPHAIYLLLKIASDLNENNDRSKKSLGSILFHTICSKWILLTH